MKLTWTDVQARRLKELNANELQQSSVFISPTERDKAFQKLNRLLVEKGRDHLKALKDKYHRPELCGLESRLTEKLTENGFVQVITPIVLAKGLLMKMGINMDHPLSSQIFWIGNNKCLRPMLAPNLYFVLKDLLRLWEWPVRIFEIGPCFRRESQGTLHLNEFTMLNLVEMGLPEEKLHERMEQLAVIVMEVLGINEYRLTPTASEIYGSTTDVVAGKPEIEVGSCAMGPHPLDDAWGINAPWVGIGFGLERLLMAKEKRSNLKSVGRSLTYLDGVRLNI
jgi:pyrrolysyl-tRNA synthetase-like protein